MLEIAYAGARGRQYLLKGNPNEAPATVGVTNSNVLRPYATISPALRDVGQVQSTGILNYHGLLTKFQRRFANGISLLASYTFAKAMDYNSDNDGLVTVPERLRHRRLQLRAGQLRHQAHPQPERHVRSCRGARASGTAAGRSAGSTTTARVCRSTSGRTPGCCRRARATAPNTIGDPALGDPDGRQVVRPGGLPADDRQHRHLGRHRARHRARDPDQSNLDMSLIKYTHGSAAPTSSCAAKPSTS